MGSRAQLKLVSTDFKAPIFLYTHWGSPELHTDLATGLERGRGRWTDPEYLARILFCAMLRPSDLTDETGYGIGTGEHGDLDYPAVEVNIDEKTVRYPGGGYSDKPERTATFEEFVKEPFPFL